MAKTKPQLIEELKALGVTDFDEKATNPALQALIDANQPEQPETKENDAEEEESENEEDTPEEPETDEEDDSDEPDEEPEPEPDAEEEDDEEDDSDDESEEETEVEEEAKILIRTFTPRHDGLDYVQKAQKKARGNGYFVTQGNGTATVWKRG